MYILKYWISTLLLLFCFTVQSQTTAACIDSVAVYGLQSPLAGLNLYSRLPLANGDMLIYNIIANGYFSDTSRSDYIIRLDSNGRFKQGCKIKITNNAGNSQRFHFAAASPDGGFALGGERYKVASDSTSFYHVVCLRFDANMNLQWQKEVLPLPNPNYAVTARFHIKTMGFSPDNRLFFSVNFNSPEIGVFFSEPEPPEALVGPGHNFFFVLDGQGNMQWSKRVSFGAGIFGGNTTNLVAPSTVLFNGNDAFFFGEAAIVAGFNQVKHGFYKLGLNSATGLITNSRIISLSNSQIGLGNYAVTFPFQKSIAFQLAGNKHSVVFREIYNSGNNALISNLHNVEIDLAGNVISARSIKRNATYTGIQIQRLAAGRTDCTIDENNNIAFFDKSVKAKKFAVVNSRNETLITKSLGATLSPDPEFNNIDFIHGGNAVSLHVTDSTNATVSQEINVPVYATDSLSSCLHNDSSFFTVTPLALTANTLPIDSIRDNIFSAVDITVEVSPYSFTRVELCKQLSICSTLKITGDTVACEGSIYRFRATKNPGCYQKTNWVVDTSMFSILQATDTVLLLSARRTGSTIVKASLGSCGLTDSIAVAIYKSAQPFSLGADTSLCSNNGVVLQLPAGLIRYQWSTGDSSGQISINTAGVYWGKIWDACGNSFMDTIRIQKFPAPVLKLGADTSLCEGTPYYLQAGNYFTQYLWSTGSTASQVAVSSAGTYWVNATDSNGCQAADTIVIPAIRPSPVIMLNDITERCIGQNDTLNAGAGYSRYQWQDGSTQSTYLISRAGTYWVTVTNQQACSTSDTTTVTKLIAQPANFITGDSLLCIGASGTLRTTRLFQKYLWSDSSTASLRSIQSPGLYRLYVTDPSGCTGTDSFSVKPIDCKNQIYFPTAFTPNGDGLNDVYKPFVSGLITTYVLTIYNRYGQKIFESKTPAKGWDGKMIDQLQPTGNYIWSCTYQFSGAELKTEKGSLMVIR